MLARGAHLLTVIVALLCLFSPHALAADKGTEDMANDAATRLITFRNDYEHKPTGFYKHGDTFFAIVSLETQARESQLTIKKRSRSGMITLLRTWFMEQEKDSITLQTLLLPSLEPEIMRFAYAQSGSFILSGLTVSVVYDNPTDKGYMYAIAGSVEELKKQGTLYTQSIQDEKTLLWQYLKSLSQSNDIAKLMLYAQDTGEDFIHARLALIDLAKHYPLANYGQSPSLMQRRVDYAIAQNPKSANDYALLAKAPANPTIMHALYARVDHDAQKHMIALLTHAAFPQTWAEQSIMRSAPQGPTAYLMSNPTKIGLDLERILGPAYPDHVVTIALQSGGALYMDTSLSHLSQDTASFQKARALFAQGGSLDAIHEHLLTALAQAPANVLAWDYLGAVYKAQKNWRDSAAIYRQLLMLDPFHAEALAAYVESLLHLGFKQEATAMALLAKAYMKSHDEALVQTIINRVLVP